MEEDLATQPSIFVWGILWTESLQSMELEESDRTVQLNDNNNDGFWSKSLDVPAVDDARESVHEGICSIPFWGFPGGSDCKHLPIMQEPGSGSPPEGGNGFPLQYSDLENPMDRGVWQATVHGVTNSGTRLSD